MATKTTLMLREELTTQLTEMINKSELPLILIPPILENLLRQSNDILARQYQDDVANYQEQLKQESEANGG